MRRNTKFVTGMIIGSTLALAGAGTSFATATAHAKSTVSAWSWAPNSTLATSAFEKANPNVTIDLTNVGAGSVEYTKLSTALAAGSGAPCVAQVEFDHLPSYEAKPGLTNIAQWADRYKADYPSWVWDLVSKGSAVYAIPQDIGPVGYAYNSSVFKKYDLAVPKTWAQFADEAVTLHKDNPKMYLTYFGSDDTELQGLLQQAGGNMFQETGDTWKIEIDSPPVEKVLDLWGNLIKEGAIPLETVGSPSYGKDVASGEFASYLEAAWDPTYLGSYMTGTSVTQDLTMTELPQWSATGKPASFDYGGSSYVVTSQCSDPQTAVAYLGWLFTTKAGISVTEGNGAVKPGTPGAGEGLFDAAKARATVSSFNQSYAQFTTQPKLSDLFSTYASQVPLGYVWSPFENYISDTWPTLIASAASGKTTFNQALSELQSDTVTFAKQEGFNVTT